MYLAYRTDILMNVAQLRDDRVRGLSPGQFLPDEGTSEHQD